MGVTTLKYIGFLVMTVGLIILTIATRDSINIINIISKGGITKGEIYQEHFAKDITNEIYYYTVKYVVKGKEYKIETNNNSSERRYNERDSCEVLYEKKNPSNGILNSWHETIGVKIVGFSLGLIFEIFGLVFVLFPKSTSKLFNNK